MTDANIIEGVINRLQHEQYDFKRSIEDLLLETQEIAVSLENERQSVELPCSESEVEKIETLVDSLEDTAKGFITMGMETTALIDHLRSVQGGPPMQSNSLDNIREEVKRQAMLPSDDEEWQRNEKYKRYKRAVWRVRHADKPLPWEEDDEIVVSSGDRAITCPLTGGVMEHPMRNTNCGHSYEREAILKYAQSGTKPCPVAGCNKQVARASLEADIELEAHIKYTKENEARNRAQSAAAAVDLDEDDDFM